MHQGVGARPQRCGRLCRRQKIEILHPLLQPGDACPKCGEGTVYDTKRPRVLVRLKGRAPVGATVYSLQKLRCNLCNGLFTAERPAGMGEEKYDATVGSMIALLRYGMGMPMNRNETLQDSLGVPLPDSTQWEIVAEQAERVEPVFEELVRQGAQGDVIYHDDTTVKILALMDRTASAEEQVDELLERGGETVVPADGATEKAEAQRTGLFTTGIVAETAEERKSPCSSADTSMPARTSRTCWRGVRRTFLRQFRCAMPCRGTCLKD